MKTITRGMQNAATAIQENFEELTGKVTGTVTSLTVGGGNIGSVGMYRTGNLITIFFVGLCGKSSGGNDSVILTIPAGYRTAVKFEALVGSIDRSTLNSAAIAFDTNGQVLWRRNSNYASYYGFTVTYQIA